MFSLPESLKNKGSIREPLACLIIGGTIKTDDILPKETALAEGFSVSKTMMHDVLRSLAGNQTADCRKQWSVVTRQAKTALAKKAKDL